jgi:hypothetical protein
MCQSARCEHHSGTAGRAALTLVVAGGLIFSYSLPLAAAYAASLPAFGGSCLSASDELRPGIRLRVFTSGKLNSVRWDRQYRADHCSRWKRDGDSRNAHQQRSRERLHILRRSAQSISYESTGVGDVHSRDAVRKYHSSERNVVLIARRMRRLVRVRL